MAAADGARRFITRADVEDAARAGRPVQLGPRDVITDEAAQCARDRGVRVERATAGQTPTRRTAADGLRAAVRAAVVAELGHEPAGLDAALDKVLASRST
jgi:hypothetical protein